MGALHGGEVRGQLAGLISLLEPCGFQNGARVASLGASASPGRAISLA